MAKRNSYVVYVDESGDEGFSFERGSSEWFVLSGVITHAATDLETVKLVDVAKSLLKKPVKKPLHFRKLKHEQRLPFVGLIADAKLKVVNIMVHKKSIREPEMFRERYRLYYYSVRYLLERVSWYCRDHKDPDGYGDGSANIVFSNRGGMSYCELRDYLSLLKRTSVVRDVRIDWDVLNPEQVQAFSPGKRMGLQIADAVATSSYYALKQSDYGYIEDRYIRMLKPIIYHHRGQYLGYGLKFWPGEAMDVLRESAAHAWVCEYFK